MVAPDLNRAAAPAQSAAESDSFESQREALDH